MNGTDDRLPAIDAMIRERDALRAAAAALIASAPRHMCHRNAKEREAYRAFRAILDNPPSYSTPSREKLVVPEYVNAEPMARKILAELMNHHIPLSLSATDLVACFISGQNRLIAHLLQLNPTMTLVDTRGVDVTQHYTANANPGA